MATESALSVQGYSTTEVWGPVMERGSTWVSAPTLLGEISFELDFLSKS